MAQRSSSGRGNLKIGDTVLLFYNADKRFATDSADKSGYILADLSGSGSRQLLTVQPSDQQLPNIQFGTFKVLASNKYEAQTRYRALFEKLKELRKKQISQNAIQLLQLQASQAKRDSEVEQAENAANQQRLKGTSINYGDSIQLLHTLTGKYVCVSSKETSVTENSKLKVYLQRKDSVGCIFYLHPHIKVQTVGEEVNYDDQIKFESVATAGQFLHCSKRTFGDVNINVNSHCFELNLAAKESPLKIIRHYQATTTRGVVQSNKALRASGIVRFFHRKHQCYIVGEGSFAGRYGTLPDVLVEDSTNEQVSMSEMSLQKSLHRLSVSTLPRGAKMKDLEPTDGDTSVFSDSNDSQTLKMRKYSSATLSKSLAKVSSTSVVREQKVSDDDEVVSEEVHFSSRRKLGSISSPPSTSPNTFWQIEKFNDPCSGEPMTWSEQCLIKHLPTRRYLAVITDATGYKVTLKSHKLNASATMFELFPAVQQVAGEIEYGSYVRVKHVTTGTWLHLNKDVRYHPISKEFDGLEYNTDDSREQYQIIATKEINSDDAFTLQKVEEKLVADFNYVAGVTTVLTNQLQQCELLGKNKPHSPEICHMKPALSSMYYLKTLLLKDKEKYAIKTKQKLLRGMKILELVIRLLNLHKDDKSIDREVCTACFEIITAYLEGNSSRNKTHISQMISHIFTPSVWETELSGGQTVERVLTGIARDNPALLFEEDFIKNVSWHLVQKLVTTDKSSERVIQLLDGLSILCSCKGDPIKQNQIFILEELQKVYGNEQHLQNMMLYPLRIKDKGGDAQSVVIQVHFSDEVPAEVEEPNSFPMTKTKEKASDWEDGIYDHIVQYREDPMKTSDSNGETWYKLSNGSETFYKFFLAQLHLLVQMCRGNNEAVINVLRGTPGTKTFGVEITFPVIMCAINDPHIKESHSPLLTMLVELLKVMYVEVGENRPFLEKLPFAFKIDEVGRIPFEATTKTVDPKKAEVTALTGMENIHFPALRLWIKNFFHAPSGYFFAADEDGNNSVVVKVLQLLAVLVKYGYYDDAEHVNDLLPSLHKLLDGKNDFPTKEVKKSILESEAQVQLRSTGWQLDLEEPDSERVEKSLSEFRDRGGRYNYMEQHHNHFEIKHWAMEVLNLLFNFQLYKNLHNFIYDFRWLLASKKELSKGIEPNKIESTSLEYPGNIKHELCRLLDTNPRDPHFRKHSRQAKKLFEAVKCHLNYILHKEGDPDLTNSNQLPNMLLDLANYDHDDLMQYALLLLDRYYTSASDIFQKALQTHLLITPTSIEVYNKVEKLLLRLSAYLRNGSNDRVDQGEDSPVKVLTEYCSLEGEVESFEPHQTNQNLILSFGILPDILRYVTQQCINASSIEHKSKKIIECLVFLRALARKNPVVQNRLLQHLDIFLKVVFSKLGPYIGGILHEIFSGGPSMALSLPEEQISKIMKLIFSRGKKISLMTDASLVDALKELLMVKELNLPLKHTQLIVARNFSLMREDDRYWCKDLISEGKRDLRWDILTSEDDSNFQLTNLLIITDLLASCVGDNAGADSICCTIYSEDELIEIISSKRIELYRKRPFMKFLVRVYMHVEGDMVEEKGFFYRRNKDLWDHMCEMAAILRQTAEVMKDMPHPSYLSVKELIVDPSWKYLHECPNRKHLQSPSPVVLSDNSKFNVSDVLLYASEGFFPFLQVFYGEFYNKDLQHNAIEGGATQELYKALLALFTPLISKRVYFTSEVQVKLYFRVLLVLKPYYSGALVSQLRKIEDYIENHSEVFHSELMTEARENYDKTYAEELDLNARFKKFVSNYKAAHEGKNTKRAQVIEARNKRNLSRTEPYSEFLDEAETKPGLRFLPLGRSFQEHVGIFKIRKENLLGLGGLGLLGDTLDIAARGINVFGLADTRGEDFVRNPKERLLKQLEISHSKMRQHGNLSGNEIDLERQTELDIKCLQILRATIYNEIIQINKNERKKQCELHLHPVQNEIQDLGNAVLRVMPLLSHPNKTITYEVLAFLEVLFEFGNRHIHEGSKELLKLHENQIFQILQEGLRTTTVVYKESQLLTSLLKARLNSDRKIITKAEMSDVHEEQDISLPNLADQTSSVRGDGSVVLTAPRRGSAIRNLFRRPETINVLIAGGDKRVPFLAIYQQSDANASLGERALSILRFSDLSRITMIIKVMGLLCDGQNREMQNFLREQSESIRNINLVGEITSVLHEFTERRQIGFDTLPLYIQTLQSLTEICVGNYKNHEIVFNRHIISIINFILQIDITEIKAPRRNASTVTVISNYTDIENIAHRQEDSKKLDYVDLRIKGMKLKASAIELLEVMTEEISSGSRRLSKLIAEGLDIRGFHSSMVDLYALKSDGDLIQEGVEGVASKALYKAYKILMHLYDHGAGSLEILKPTEKSALRAWQFCEKKSHSIEIVYKDEENDEKVLTRVHFDTNINTEIKEDLRDSVKYQVDRTTHSDKLRDFHEWMEAVKKDTLHQDWLKRKHLNPITFFSRQRYWILLLLTLLLNIIVIAVYTVPSPINDSIPTKPNIQVNPILFYAFGGLHILLSFWMVLEYFIVTWPHFVLPEFLYKIRLIPNTLGRYRTTAWLTRLRILPRFHRTYSSVNIFGVTTLYPLIFLVSSVASLGLIHIGFTGYFYCICLLYIIINNDVLQRALQSVTKNWKSLFWVALLLLAILFIYSVIAFAFFQREFEMADNVFCDSLDQCFVSVLRFGLIDNFLDIGFLNNSIDMILPSDNNAQAAGARNRFFFDITLFIIITTIGLNIVLGIIVDTFSELRDARHNAEQDMKSVCFICGLPSHDFEKQSNQGFLIHVKNDHNMWTYIYYSIYLDRVDINDQNATEKYVYERLKDADTNYMPFHQALVLEGEKDEGEELKKELQELHNVMKQRFMNMNVHFDARLDAIEKLLKVRNEQ